MEKMKEIRLLSYSKTILRTCVCCISLSLQVLFMSFVVLDLGVYIKVVRAVGYGICEMCCIGSLFRSLGNR